ncbi:MAG: hypothetical protein JWM89_3616 [Acidimicrobiales bacterium]|nr:hypothetical protein [Acidimicrobiales bacterium]
MTDQDCEAHGLQLTFQLDGDVASVGISGDVEADGLDGLRRMLQGALSLGARRILLDCSQATYLDSAGVRLLLDLHRILSPDGGSIRVLDPSTAVRSVLTITGLDALLQLG